MLITKVNLCQKNEINAMDPTLVCVCCLVVSPVSFVPPEAGRSRTETVSGARLKWTSMGQIGGRGRPLSRRLKETLRS